jgi:hypothetical protein
LEASVPPLVARVAESRRARIPTAAEWAASWTIAFALTTELALSGGGYDIVVRSEIGILIWWLLLLGVVAGVLPRVPLSRSTWAAVVLLVGFFAWSWVATSWSRNQELTLIEVSRVATYAGTFALGCALMNRRSAYAVLCGLAAGIALVCGLAVLSKLVPSLFPADPTAHLYATPRLRYPFDYSDGVGEFAALAIPLLWYLASRARTIWARALAGAALPVVLLCLAMTVSRGGTLAAVVGVVVFLALSPDRLSQLVSGVVCALGTLMLTLALLSRKGLTHRLFAAAPTGQRHSMLVIVVVVVIVVGLVQAGVAWAGRRSVRPAWTRIGRRGAGITSLAIAALILAGVIALVGTGAAHHLWEQFKRPHAPTNGNSYFRLLSVAGSHRYQYWQVAIHAFQSSPWKGIGPGTFQFYWAQHQTLGEYVLNAHSLWIETLAELGIVGFALIVSFFLWVIIRGGMKAVRAPLEARAFRAAAVAGVAAFCAAAAFDWVWQIGVIPMVTMMLCAICVSDHVPSGTVRGLPRWAGRLALGLAGLVALWAIAIPLATTVEVRRSQSAIQAGELSAALRDADNARQIEPVAFSPRLQLALLLEQLGDIRGAAAAISQAEARAPTDWQIWLVASRIATEQNQPNLALRDYQRARSLNPRSPIFKT